jgi:hypothetical protein
MNFDSIVGAYFIDREGKYFAPILEYLRTGEVFLPKDMPPQFVAREAQYYGIDMPINEVVEKSMMSFITGTFPFSHCQIFFFVVVLCVQHIRLMFVCSF